jgi:hypothetical protein
MTKTSAEQERELFDKLAHNVILVYVITCHLTHADVRARFDEHLVQNLCCGRRDSRIDSSAGAREDLEEACRRSG